LKDSGHISCETPAHLSHNLHLKNRLDIGTGDVHYQRLVNRSYNDVPLGEASVSVTPRFVLIRILTCELTIQVSGIYRKDCCWMAEG
jgi:hypothetical protein